MNILSLFDGMSGGQIALTNMGVKIDAYYASEIDKHAIAQTQLNFPNTKQLGSVTEWQTWDIDWSSINILFAGSPCQGFSFAGKQLAFNDPRSKLFFVFVDILNHIRKFNPNVLFLLENVKMKAEHEAVITQYVGVNPIEINSALLSAQNRVRLYWTNIGVVKRGLFDEYYPGIPQPKDKGILLRDILESDVPEKYYLSEKMLKNMQLWKDSGNGIIGHSGSGGQKGSIFDTNNKVGSLCATDYKQAKQICVASRGRNPENPKSRKVGLPTEQQLEPRNDGKTNCLTSVQKDNLVLYYPCDYRSDEGIRIRENGKAPTLTRGAETSGTQYNSLVMQINPSKESGGQQPYQQNSVYDSNGISPALCANKADLLVSKDYRIRRLTPTECARLQTIPTWYKWQCSDTQQYRMLGNGWTNDVIEWILSFAKF